MQVRKQQLELDMKQQTGSKLGKDYIKAVYCHAAYLIYVQSISCEMLDCMNHKLQSRLLGEISTTRNICISDGRKKRGTKEPLDEGERRGWKSWLETPHS